MSASNRSAQKAYSVTTYRDYSQPTLWFQKPKKQYNIELMGLPLSGRTALFKQICMGSGVFFRDADKMILRYHLIKPLMLGMKRLLDQARRDSPEVLDGFNAEADVVLSYANYFTFNDRPLEDIIHVTLALDMKDAIVKLWALDDLKKMFDTVATTAALIPMNTTKILLDRLSADPAFFALFGSEKYLPEKSDLILANGWKFNSMEQYMLFTVKRNLYLKENKVSDLDLTEDYLGSRPDKRVEVLKHPLSICHFNIYSTDEFWRIIFRDSNGDSQRKSVGGDRDKLIYVANLASYDILVNEQKPSSVLSEAAEDFGKCCTYGHVTALIFTNFDQFRRKYITEKIPLNKLKVPSFQGAPTMEEEFPDSCSYALKFVHKVFIDARHAALTAKNENSLMSRLSQLLRVFTINSLDYENMDTSVRIALEDFLGLNVPVRPPLELEQLTQKQ